ARNHLGVLAFTPVFYFSIRYLRAIILRLLIPSNCALGSHGMALRENKRQSAACNVAAFQCEQRKRHRPVGAAWRSKHIWSDRFARRLDYGPVVVDLRRLLFDPNAQTDRAVNDFTASD